MEIELSCECGVEISEFTRGSSTEANFKVPCEDCGAVYTVTITQIRGSESA